MKNTENIKVLSSEKKYSGKIIGVRVDTIEEKGVKCFREIVEHCEAACVMPVDDEGYTYLVRQYRHGIGRYTEEFPAGKVDIGETGEECAVRECHEEIGAVCEDICYYMPMPVSPAYCEEIIHLYFAKVKMTDFQQLDDDEFLSVERVSVEEVVRRIDSGEITDAKTVILALAYLRRFNQQN